MNLNLGVLIVFLINSSRYAVVQRAEYAAHAATASLIMSNGCSKLPYGVVVVFVLNDVVGAT